MLPITLFSAFLKSSQSEQRIISIYLSNAVLRGIVTDITMDAVEIRTQDGKRCLISGNKIEAVELA